MERVPAIDDRRVEDAFRFVVDRGVQFPLGSRRRDFSAEATQATIAIYLAVLDLVDEFGADCVGWQYQLGLLKLLPPSDFSEGLAQLVTPARG